MAHGMSACQLAELHQNRVRLTELGPKPEAAAGGRGRKVLAGLSGASLDAVSHRVLMRSASCGSDPAATTPRGVAWVLIGRPGEPEMISMRVVRERLPLVHADAAGEGERV
jgi:hypothetical protein